MNSRAGSSEIERVIAAGFLLLRPVPRPQWVSRDLLPDRIVSGSTCICPQFPGTYAISWCDDSAERRIAEFDRIGVRADARADATQWATDEFEKSYGWPGVFYTLEATIHARARFFPGSDLVVVALGLPARCRDDFVRHATPPPPRAGFAPQGRSGCLDTIEKDGRLPPSVTPLGYEPVNVVFGQMDHSWLCNHLEQYAADNLGIRPGPSGLIDSFEDAVRCCEAIAGPDVGAEPGPWFPWLLARCDRIE